MSWCMHFKVINLSSVGSVLVSAIQAGPLKRIRRRRKEKNLCSACIQIAKGRCRTEENRTEHIRACSILVLHELEFGIKIDKY